MRKAAGSPQWRRSSRCDSSACVEVAEIGDSVAVRDGKDPDGPVLTFARTEWSAFVACVQNGNFDRV